MKPYNNILVIMLQCERCLSTDIWGSWKGFPMAGCRVNGIAMRPHYLPHKLLRDKHDVWPDMSHIQRRAGIGSGTFCEICSIKCSLFLVNISQGYCFKRSSLETLKWSKPAGELRHNVAAGSCKLPMEKQISANAKTHHEETHKETGALQWNV